jgi:polysaccharide chain length determinant protein (PEP-CTERM system associated)
VIPGKKYKPEDILQIAWRRRWVIVLPLLLASAGTFIWVRQLPDRYRSDAQILVVPPQISTKFVKPVITEALSTRLQAVREKILSRPMLEALINEFDLYPNERRKRLMDDVVTMARGHITVGGPKKTKGRKSETLTFPVSYESDNPRTAMLVAERLASLVVRESLENRATRTDTTAQFLQRQLDEARKDLVEHEARLQAFQVANSGRLPAEAPKTLALLQNAQQQLQSIAESINRDRDRQMRLDRTIADELAIAASTASSPVDRDGKAKPQTVAQQLQVVRAELKNLELKLTPEHPDVKAAKRQIAELEKKAEAEALQQPLSGDGLAAALSAGDAAKQKRVASLRAEIESVERRITSQRAEGERLQAQMNDYRAKLASAPAVEAQFNQLTRGDEILKAKYTSLLRKSEDARMAQTLEESQVGEQFRIVDSARLPQLPTSPDRARLNLLGIFAGFGLGLTLAALLEYRDTTLRSEGDVLAALALPVVALVPTMMTVYDRRRRRKRRMLMASTTLVAVVLSVAALLWKTRLLGAWVQ